MSDTPEKASIVFRTGHKLEFAFFAFRQIPGGYEFIDYPETKGYKTVRLIRSDAIASIEVTARETELDTFALTAALPPAPSGIPAAYADGDPQHAPKNDGPRTYVARDPTGRGTDPRANRGTYTPTKDNPLRSEIVGENGAPEITNAAMV